MSRMTREESRALTRERLLASAETLFGRDGYASTSVERIAEDAGFSKGALYSNVDGKEAIFLAVLERQGTASLDGVVADVASAPDAAAIRSRLVRWADERSRSGNWSMTILEHARAAGAGSPSVKRQEAIIRAPWVRLGRAVLGRLPTLAAEPELLGGSSTRWPTRPPSRSWRRPTAGALMELVLGRLDEVAGG